MGEKVQTLVVALRRALERCRTSPRLKDHVTRFCVRHESRTSDWAQVFECSHGHTLFNERFIHRAQVTMKTAREAYNMNKCLNAVSK